MKDENELDQFFKKGLAEPDLPFNELDWEKMEQKLAPQKQKRSVILWPIAAGIAASILLVFFLMFQQNETITFKDKSASKAPIVKPLIEGIDQPLSKEQVVVIEKSKAVKESTAIVALPVEVISFPLTERSVAIAEVTKPIFTELNDSITPTSHITEVPIALPATKKPISKANPAGRLAFSIIAAPDLSSSQSNLSSKLSTNLGLLATYSITKNISLSTGMIYARKLYEYSGASIS